MHAAGAHDTNDTVSMRLVGATVSTNGVNVYELRCERCGCVDCTQNRCTAQSSRLVALIRS